MRRDFRHHELPYEEALASLDLAVLWLEQGRATQVRELAVEMEAVFRVKKIHREALAALTLFCQAARKEGATVDLARRLGAYPLPRRSRGDEFPSGALVLRIPTKPTVRRPWRYAANYHAWRRIP